MDERWNETNETQSVSITDNEGGDDARRNNVSCGANLVKIKKFHGHPNENVLDWLKEFELVTGAAGWSNLDRLRKCPMHLRDTAYLWYESRFINGDVVVFEWPDFKDHLKQAFLPQDYRGYLLDRLESYRQSDIEPVNSYIYRMESYCKEAFPTMSFYDMSDRILRGMKARLRQYIRNQTFSSITEMVDVAKIAELAAKDAKLAENEEQMTKQSMRSGHCNSCVDVDALVNQIQSKFNFDIKNSNKKQAEKDWYEKKSQNRNDKPSRYDKNMQCEYCAYRGHTENFCRIKQRAQSLIKNKKKSNVSADDVDDDDRVSKYEPGKQSHVTNLTNMRHPTLIFEVVKINGRRGYAMIDPGSEITLITDQFVQINGFQSTPLKDLNATGVTGHSLNFLGECRINVNFFNVGYGCNTFVNALIVPKLNLDVDILIGQDVNRKVGILVNCKNQRIVWQNVNLVTINNPHSGTVHCVDEVTVPSRSVKIVEIKPSNKKFLKHHSFVIGSSDKQYRKNGVCLSNGIVNFRNNSFVNVANFKQHDIHLKSQSVIGNYEIVENVSLPGEAVTNTVNKIDDPTRQDVRKDENLVRIEKFNVETSDVLQSIELKVGSELKTVEAEQIKSLVCERIMAFVLPGQNTGTASLFKHTIDTGDHKPVSFAPYRQSQEKREITAKLIEDMLENEVIETSMSPWASPVVLVKKSTGDWRFCVDYRKLNSITKKDVYPLPLIQDSLDYLSGAKYFTSLDCKGGYHQIKVDEKDKEKTAFVTPDGLFQFRKMPFGLCNAPATFQRCMDVVLAGLKYHQVLVYLDDILIYDSTFEKHLNAIDLVLLRIINAGLKLNLAKCTFGLSQCTFLGFLITNDGQYPDPRKLKSIKEFPIPKCLRDVQSFVALCSYYRKFIKDFAQHAKPLTLLTKNEVGFKWEAEQRAAFDNLKTRLITPPVLAHFTDGLEIEIRTDACREGVGAVLLQKHDSGFKPVVFVSRQLLDRETRYTVSEQECLAIVFALEKFKHYIDQKKFRIVTDHCALCFLKTKRELPPRLMRWSLLLQEFEYDIVYKSGKHHKDVDCLSRYALPATVEDSISIQEFENRAHVNEIVTLDEETFKEAQRNDPFCRGLIEKLSKITSLPMKEVKNVMKYSFEDGILKRKCFMSTGEVKCLLVPLKMRKLVCRIHHDDPTAGHMGPHKTYERIRQFYYWPGMSTFIIAHAISCEKCQKKNIGKSTEGRLHPMTSNAPFDRVGIDIVGPLPKSSGKKFIIVAIDYFTKFVEAKAVANASSVVTANFLINEVFLRHGAPCELISDNGRNFISSVIRDINRVFCVKHRFTTAYHPQSNGQVERVNSVITRILAKYVNATQSNWCETLKLAVYAYNTTPHSSTSFSPFELLYVRKPMSPQEAGLKFVRKFENVQQYMSFVENEMQIAREIAITEISKSKEKNVESHDQNVRDVSFEIGDKVLVYTPTPHPGLAKKLSSYYMGPFKVVEKRNENVYVVECIEPPHDRVVVNISRMKKFHQRDESLRMSPD